jgi:hypothetical protein
VVPALPNEEKSMKSVPLTREIKSRVSAIAVVLAAVCMPGISNAQGRNCSNATLEGGYGFFVHATVLPAGTPRAIIGRFVFDGRGSFVNTLTFNDNGTIVQGADAGTYTVNADCTGRILTNGGTRAIEIVIVDEGKEFYQLRTDPPNIVFLFNAAKKQLPGNH